MDYRAYLNKNGISQTKKCLRKEENPDFWVQRIPYRHAAADWNPDSFSRDESDGDMLCGLSRYISIEGNFVEFAVCKRIERREHLLVKV